MLNILKKSLLTGIGLALIAKDEVEDLARELAQKGHMSEKEANNESKHKQCCSERVTIGVTTGSLANQETSV